MICYTAAIPNRTCQQIIEDEFPKMRFMLSPACRSSFGKTREHLLYKHGYAIDNGAYSYHMKGQPFNETAFLSLCDEFHEFADWIVIPDSVGNWKETISLSIEWTKRLRHYRRPLMFVAQDGAERDEFETLRRCITSETISGGVFVGGSTEWKLEHIGTISELCRQAGKICHVGRVNTRRRLLKCFYAGASSVDGSGMSRFNGTTRLICRTMDTLDRQIPLF